MKLNLLVGILSLCAGLCGEALAESTVWPSFQNGGEVTVAVDSGVWTNGVVTTWTADLEGHGQSSPVIWNALTYVTSTVGPNKDIYRVTALRIDSGEIAWTYDVANPSPRESNFYVSRAAPTPAVDDAGIVAFFESGVVVALDHAGAERWTRNLVDDYGKVGSRFGLSSSVEQAEDFVFVWVEREDDPYVVALRKDSGETVWKVGGLGSTAWSSPRLLPVGRERHLVLSADGSVVGLNPDDGERLWELSGLSGNTSPTPMPVADGRFLIGASAGRASEVSESVFESNGQVVVTKANGGWEAAFEWTGERTAVSFSSPIANDGIAYFVNRSGVLTAVDARSGQKVFAKRLAGTLWATPIAMGSTVMFPLKEGVLQWIAAGDEFREVASHRLVPEADPEAAEGRGRFGGPIVYGAAFASDRLIVRTGEQVFCVTPKYE